MHHVKVCFKTTSPIVSHHPFSAPRPSF